MSTYEAVIETIKLLQQQYPDLVYYSINLVGKGGMNEIYEVILRVNNTIRPYIFRIFMNPDAIDINTYYDKLTSINNIFASNNNKCLFNECHHDTIGCSYCVYKINNTVVEIMDRYDMSLKDFLVNQSYNNLCQNSVLNILEFNKTVKFIDQFITYFRQHNIGHGDIKPENILIKTNNNKITKLIIADLDGLCINNKRTWFNKLKQANNAYSCGSMAFTSAYTTKKIHQEAKKMESQSVGKDVQSQTRISLERQLSDAKKQNNTSLVSELKQQLTAIKRSEKLNSKEKNTNMLLKDVQDSDLYAVSIVILMLWFGYESFFEIFKTATNMQRNIKQQWFDLEMDEVFNVSNKQAILNAYTSEINKLDGLKDKIDHTMNAEEMVKQVDKARNYLLKSLNWFVNIQLQDNTQQGGNDSGTHKGSYRYVLR